MSESEQIHRLSQWVLCRLRQCERGECGCFVYDSAGGCLCLAEALFPLIRLAVADMSKLSDSQFNKIEEEAEKLIKEMGLG